MHKKNKMRIVAENLNQVLNAVRSDDARHSRRHLSSPALSVDFSRVKLVGTESSQTHIAHMGKCFKDAFSWFRAFSASGG